MQEKVRAAVMAALLFTIICAPAAGADRLMSRSDAEVLLSRMQQAYENVRDYTAVFHKKCVLPDDDCPDEKAFMKFQKPFALYMKWQGPAHEDQEMIYVQGLNGGQIMGHPGSFPDVTLSLAPDSGLVMHCNRRTVTQSGIGNMIAITETILEAYPRAVLRDEGNIDVYGVNCRCFSIQRSAPGKNPDDCWVKARLCASDEDLLPRRATFWDGNGTVIEDYGYSDVKFNIGLTDIDFDPDNPEYDF